MMKRLFLVLAVGFGASLSAVHIGFLMPAGARRGGTVDLIVGGQAFGGVNDVSISGGGVTVEYVEPVRSIPHPARGQRRYLYRWLRNIHCGDPRRPPLPEDVSDWSSHAYYDRLPELSDCERDILYRFLFVPRNSLQSSPAIDRRVLVRLRIAPNALPGEREFRLVSNGRASNPLKFFIGDLPEFREPYFTPPPFRAVPPHFTVPAVLNGQITPGESDAFTFTAKRGEVITFSALGRALLPFIGDGVPGHFQMVLEVLDAAGRTAAYADDRFFDPDPELVFTAPADGTYTLKVRDALYRGREDFVYRITATAGPPARRRLPPPDVPGASRSEGRRWYGKTVELPALIRDTLRTPAGNRYRFRGEAGRPVMLEVFARRQGSPVDSLLRVRDGRGNVLAVNDDVSRLRAGTVLHRGADSMIRFVPPENGIYTVEVTDLTGACGPDFQYFLRLDRERPRFAVYIVPSAVAVNANGVGAATLVVERFDGFAGEIKLRLRGGDGFAIAGADTIPAGCDRTAVTFSTASRRPLPLTEVKLLATGGGYTVQAIPGDEMTQAFAYTHIVPTRRLLLSCLRLTPGRERFDWAGPVRSVTLDREVTLTARMNVRRLPENAAAELVPVNPPPWLIVRSRIAAAPAAGTEDWRPLSLTLYAAPEGRGKAVNQLFKVVYSYNRRPDRDGKVHRVEQQIVLPAVRVEGGGRR